MHMMIDLETLGTKSDACIIQIGLAIFSADPTDPVIKTKQINVNPETSIGAGMSVDYSTVRWWMEQSEAARGTLPKEGEGEVLSDALNTVNRMFKQHKCSEVWGNGSSFDITIMESAYRLCGRVVPWRYSKIRDVRTLAMVCPEADRPRPTVAHNAAADAKAQALWVRNMFATFGYTG